MGKMPDALRETIARNIRDCRLRKFPGRGGGKRCAESFGVSPQQWSPWESGKRTPDELRLEQIASFFDTSVEWFRRDHRVGGVGEAAVLGVGGGGGGEGAIVHTQTLSQEVSKGRLGMAPFGNTSLEDDINHYLWLMDILTKKLTSNGIRVVITFEKAQQQPVLAGV